MTISQLSERLGIEEPNIRTTIKRLKDKEVVEETGMFIERYKIYRMTNKALNTTLLLKMIMKMEGVLAVALISNEGFPIYSALPQGMDETRVGAMTAALVSLGIRACKETRKGNLNILYIQGDEGKILLVDCGSDFVLTISLDDTINKEQLFTQHFQTIDLLRATIADLSLI